MSEAGHFVRRVRRAPRPDVVILLVTFALTVFADLVVAVNIGVILATLHFRRRIAVRVDVGQVAEKELQNDFAHLGFDSLLHDVMIYAVDASVFFGAVERFECALAGTHNDPRLLILRLRRMPFIGATGLQALEDAIRGFHGRGVEMVLCAPLPGYKASCPVREFSTWSARPIISNLRRGDQPVPQHESARTRPFKTLVRSRRLTSPYRPRVVEARS